MRTSLSPGLTPKFMSSYPTTAENTVGVVGCTVTLMQDTQTGALQHDRFWNALQRDWVGFVAVKLSEACLSDWVEGIIE
jgi:hypothetical protein